ncbi:MAG: pyruvate formate lyase family protein [Dehalococcoidales bacterium]|nr:pyruvate formate lyase family protein [Dehalococcoidales bacterium]
MSTKESINVQKEITRSQRLWERLLETRSTAPVSQWRARLLTASWKETEGLPIPIRRAKAFEKIMNEVPIFLDEDQLLAGNYGSWPMAIEWRPETTVEWINERFEAGIGRLIIKEEDIPEIKEIAAYWKDKDVFSRYHRYIGKEEEQRLKDRDFMGAYLGHSYYPALWALGWFIPDYPKAIRKGLLGILAEVKQEIQSTPLLDEASQNKRFFLESLEITIKAAIQYAKRHAALARELAQTAESKRKDELEKIAEICEWVPANPARTFYEALQTLWFCNLFIFWDSQYEGVSPGRVDQYLYPYYRKDIEEGRITREEAIEILELLRCLFSTYRVFLEAAHATRTAGEANWFNCMLGGLTADGQDATNELSYLWLEAAKRLGTPHPTLSVRVHDKMNEDFALKAAELCSLGRGYPAFFGDESNIGFLRKQGIPENEAWDYAIAGCTLTQVPGRMAPANPFGMNIPKFLELTLHNGVDPRTGRQFGPQTGSLESFENYEDLWEAYRQQVRSYIRQGADDFRKASLFQATVLPHLFPSVLADDCIKRGQPHNGQGCRYQQGMWYLLPQGPIDVADSLAAIKKCVYEDKTITKRQLMEALAADFEGEKNQTVRQILLSAPKYGNDDDYVDLIARDVYSMLDIELADINACYGAKYVQAPHSLTGHGAFGRAVGALPSGRRAWVALADGNASPSQGMDKKGVTAVLKSASKLDQLPMQGCLLNQKLHPSTLKSKEDLNKFVSLTKTYLINLKGKHIQFNVISKDILLDAKAHPEQYRTLVIRVAGYSALWVDLDSVIQDEIIARTEQEL